MDQDMLNLYSVDMKYIDKLHRVDDRVLSVSPQIGKSTRPFIGVVVVMGEKKYCIPLTSPKEKFKMKSKVDFIKIPDPNLKDEHGAPKIIGILNLNNMIPISEDVIKKIDLSSKSSAGFSRDLMIKELKWCRDNSDIIINRANKLYAIITLTPEKDRNLTRRCCDFKKLEGVLELTTDKQREFNAYKAALEKHEAVLRSDSRVRELYNAAAKKYFEQNSKKSPIDSNAPFERQLATAKALRDECNRIVLSDNTLKVAYIKAKQAYEQRNLQAHRKPDLSDKKPPRHGR